MTSKQINSYTKKKDLDVDELDKKTGSKAIQKGKMEKIQTKNIKHDMNHNPIGLKDYFDEQDTLKKRFQKFDIDASTKAKQIDMQNKLKWLFDNRRL